MKKQQINPRLAWLVFGLVFLGYGVGGGISNYSDHGLSILVIMQIGGGLLASIVGFSQALNKKN